MNNPTSGSLTKCSQRGNETRLRALLRRPAMATAQRKSETFHAVQHANKSIWILFSRWNTRNKPEHFK